MRWTVGGKLYGMGGIAITAAVVLAITGYVGISGVDKAMDEIVVNGRGEANQLVVDMMHDAVRGDVMAALLADNQIDRARAASELDDHLALLQEKIAANDELELGAVRQTMEAAEVELNAYVESGEALITLSTTDLEAALAGMPPFMDAFDDLEVKLDQVSQLIQARTIAAQASGDASVGRAKLLLVIVAVVSTLVLMVCATLITRGITKPLVECVHSLEGLARQEFRKVDIKSQDEIGQMAASLNESIDGMSTALQEVKEAGERQEREAEELRTNVDSILEVVSAATEGDLTKEMTVSGEDAIGQMGEGLGRFFGDLCGSMGTIGQNSHSLAGAAEELTALSTQMGSNAEETTNQASAVSTAADQVSANVQTVATSAEELAASIKEIAQNATHAAEVATSAVQLANETNATVAKLGASSEEIGGVIKVITSIAAQTNLLALNATIEAASAGDAGKGFAVVAHEVKELAGESAKAAEDISKKISAIQTDSKAAVEAIGEISEIIAKINEIQATIASAVEEQIATTNEIGRNVQEAAKASNDIAENITGVASAAQNTAEGVSNSLTAANDLARMAGELQTLVGRFKYESNGSSGARSGSQRAVATVN